MNNSTQSIDAQETDASTTSFKGYRPLKSNELPKAGDFFASEHGFEPWEGPTGFRADAFLKPIYRPEKRPPQETHLSVRAASGLDQRRASGLAKQSRNAVPPAFLAPARAFNSQLG